MNDESLSLKTEMLRLTEQIKLYEKKTLLIPNIFSNKAVLQRHRWSGTNKNPVTLLKNGNYILCRDNLFK